MPVKASAEMLKPNGSHWLNGEYGRIDKEELHPTLAVELPRVGAATIRYEVNRYLHSSGWSDWRMFPRELPKGVGDYTTPTHRAVREACEPIIQAWLASPAYAASRRVAAARMVVRAIEKAGTTSYGISRARGDLATFQGELAAKDAKLAARAIDHLAKASALLAEVGK